MSAPYGPAAVAFGLTTVPRARWPKPTPAPCMEARAPESAPEGRWRATDISCGLAPERHRDRKPWRHADRMAQVRMRARLRASAAVLAALAMIVASSHAVRGYLLELQADLASERTRIEVLSDSVAQYRVAIRGRTEQLVTLEKSRDVRLPVTGRVASGFSPQRLHPILKLWRAHEGVDIPAPHGAPVRPVAPGRVVKVGRELGYGLVVEVDHGRVNTRYAHLSRALRRVGDFVEAGEIVGLVGETGLATAPHLHYEVLRGKTPVNPLAHALRVIELVPSTTFRVADSPTGVSAPPPPPPPRVRPAGFPRPSVVPTSSSPSEL